MFEEDLMPVLHRDALEASPLADLHAIASELGIDGFRRLRKAELIDRILRDSGGEAAAPEDSEDSEDSGGDVAVADPEIVDEEVEPAEEAEEAEEADARPRRRRGARGGRGRSGRDEADRDGGDGGDAEPAEPSARTDETIEGVVELLGNGSGFVRVSPPEPSEGDVYISAAQVRRCELVSGDRVSGPVRKPRRSERYPSLVRVDTINGAPAEEVAEGTPYDELPCAYPSVIEWLTPIGRGSRVAITGRALAGKTDTLRRLAAALAGVEGLELSLVLTGVRPEEAAEWKAGSLAPTAALTLAAGADAQGQALERAVETAQRIAARGGHAVVLVDTLDAIAPAVARRAMAAARAIVDGGSLTVIATASSPLGGETTVIGLDARRTAARNFPALDLSASGTLRPELLVGDAGADAIAAAWAEAG
jgi:transcription termination factor Rho